MRHVRDLAPVRSCADLFERWQSMMGDGGFGRRSLWMIFFDDAGMMLPVVTPIDDVPVVPEPRVLDNLGQVVTSLIASTPAESVAMLLSRPGPTAMGAGDRAFARAVSEMLARHGAATWPLHLATTDRLQVFAPDDLILSVAS